MLMRFDPFRELDQVTQELFRQTSRSGAAMDAYRHGEEFVVHFDLPGVDPSSIDLTVEKNVLTLTASRGQSYGEGDEVLVAERPQGEFRRQLFLGEQLDTDAIAADYDRGVLTLRLPVAEQAKPRKVEIAASGSRKQLSTSAG
ncbi:MAG: Hsp20/alpha crystallin family protein [Actinomycetota bacterium]|jgi:HSP20 family protein|nr:Hsp20/alpha crystallin family protein [Actinomycetota bacterium]